MIAWSAAIEMVWPQGPSQSGSPAQMSIDSWAEESYSVVEQISCRIGLGGTAALPGHGWRSGLSW